MSLDSRLSKLESLMSPQVPVSWTTWEQDRINADLFHCRQTGEVAHWDELSGRPRTTIIEYTDEPATILHLPGGVTRTIGVGRDEDDDAG